MLPSGRTTALCQIRDNHPALVFSRIQYPEKESPVVLFVNETLTVTGPESAWLNNGSSNPAEHVTG
jgi:hypothetical protein